MRRTDSSVRRSAIFGAGQFAASLLHSEIEASLTATQGIVGGRLGIRLPRSDCLPSYERGKNGIGHRQDGRRSRCPSRRPNIRLLRPTSEMDPSEPWIGPSWRL